MSLLYCNSTSAKFVDVRIKADVLSRTYAEIFAFALTCWTAKAVRVIAISLLLIAISTWTWIVLPLTNSRALLRTEPCVSCPTMTFIKNRYVKIIGAWPNIICRWWPRIDAGFRSLTNNTTRCPGSYDCSFLVVILTWAGCAIAHRHERICCSFDAEGDTMRIFPSFRVFKVLARPWYEILQWGGCLPLEVLTFGGSVSARTLCT